MGNACAELKALVTLVIDDVEDDGLAKTLSDLGLIGAGLTRGPPGMSP